MKKRMNGPHLCLRATMKYKRDDGQGTEEILGKASQRTVTIKNHWFHNYCYILLCVIVYHYIIKFKRYNDIFHNFLSPVW